jgi:hypothetical protein
MINIFLPKVDLSQEGDNFSTGHSCYTSIKRKAILDNELSFGVE